MTDLLFILFDDKTLLIIILLLLGAAVIFHRFRKRIFFFVYTFGFILTAKSFLSLVGLDQALLAGTLNVQEAITVLLLIIMLYMLIFFVMIKSIAKKGV